MTIASTAVQTSGASCNGSTTSFSFSLRIADYGSTAAEDQIEVVLETISTGSETTLTRGVHYSVSVNADQDASPGGSITTVSTYSSAYKIWIRLNPAFLQETDLQSQGAYSAAVIEGQLDEMQRQINWLRQRVLRAPHVGVQTTSSFDGEITGDLSGMAGLAIVVNADEDGYEFSDVAGPTGPTGVSGNALRWTFSSSTTTAADPGAGYLRLNNATLASVTEASISDDCAETGTPDASAWVLTWDDSTTTHKGYLIVKKESAPQNFVVFSLTALNDQSGYTRATISYVSGSGSFSNGDTLLVGYSRTGDKGATGAGSGDLISTNNLSDLSNAGTARTNLGLGSIATQAANNVSITGGAISGITDLPVADGGTGASTAAAAWTNLTLIGKDQIYIDAASMKPRGSNGCAALATVETSTNKVNIETLDFDASSIEYAQFRLRLPKRWATSTFTAKFHWKHAATTTNFDVIWAIQAGAFGDNEALDTAFGSAQTVTDTGGVTNNHYITAATSAVTIANLTAQELVFFQVYRNATSGSDTLAIDAGLIGVELEFTSTAPTDD